MRRTIVKNYKDILTSKNTIFTIIIVVGLGLLIGLVIHQEHIQAERGNIALSKQHKNGQDVEQVKNAIKDFNIDSETIIEDWKKIQELKPTSDEGKKTLADFLTSTADKITNHYTEKALKLDIKESDSQFEDKQALETAITSLQKILEIIKSVNSTSEQATIDEKIKPIQELISKFQKQVEVLTKKEEEEEQKSNKKETETTSNVEGRESYSSEGGSYTPSYTESNGNRYNSQAPASEQYSSDGARSGGNTAVNTRDQATDTAGAQGDTNTNNNSNNAEVPDANSNNRTNSAGETPESRQP